MHCIAFSGIPKKAQSCSQCKTWALRNLWCKSFLSLEKVCVCEMQAGNGWCEATWIGLGKDVTPPLQSSGYVSCVQIKENAGWFLRSMDHQSHHIMIHGSKLRPRGKEARSDLFLPPSRLSGVPFSPLVHSACIPSGAAMAILMRHCARTAGKGGPAPCLQHTMQALAAPLP